MSSFGATSSTPRPRLSDVHKRRLDVFVEIPPSPLHGARLTPKNTPQSMLRTRHMDSSKHTAPDSASVKRKRDVYVEIAPSPLHRTTPRKMTGTTNSNSLNRRRSQVYVEIPASPLSAAHTQGTLNYGMRPSPLSAKAFNSNIPTEPLLKKLKIHDTEKHAKKSDIKNIESYPNGYFYCHQCRRKCDNSFGLHCTILSNMRCKSKYCRPCLRNRYGQDIEAIKSRAVSQSNKHVPGVAYQWTCPKCSDNCNCTNCRKSKGLLPTGKLSVPLTVAGTDAPARAGKVAIFIAYGPAATSTTGREISNGQPEQPKPRAPRTKKPVREPKWTAVSAELGRSQIEDRFFLREFILRFSPLMPRIGVTHMEELDLFHTLSRSCAKALVHGLLDLIAADADGEEQKFVRETLKKVSNSGMSPALLWARLEILRRSLPKDFFVVPIPDPSSRPYFVEDESEEETELPPPQRASSRLKMRRGVKNTQAEEEEELDLNDGVTHSIQLLPCIMALCECALQGASVRAEIGEGAADARGENRAYAADVRKENERWAKERVKFGKDEEQDDDQRKEMDKVDKNDPTKKGKAKTKDTEKDKAFREARAAHKVTLENLENAHMLELQGAAPRFGPLGRDSQGRVYYAASVRRGKGKRSKAKIPEEDDRVGLRKWGWFLAVWGPGGVAGSDRSSGQREERWWGFADPVEVRQLAKWLAAVEGVDGKESVVEGPDGKTVQGGAVSKTDKAIGGDSVESNILGPPTDAQRKALVKRLDDYADLLAWRLAGSEAT